MSAKPCLPSFAKLKEKEDYQTVIDNIDTKNKSIRLTYGGQIIDPKAIVLLKRKLPKYNLDTSMLTIRQGFAYLKYEKLNEHTNQLTQALTEKENQIQLLQNQLDSLNSKNELSQQVFKELRTQFSTFESFILQPSCRISTEGQKLIWV